MKRKTRHSIRQREAHLHSLLIYPPHKPPEFVATLLPAPHVTVAAALGTISSVVHAASPICRGIQGLIVLPLAFIPSEPTRRVSRRVSSSPLCELKVKIMDTRGVFTVAVNICPTPMCQLRRDVPRMILSTNYRRILGTSCFRS